MITWWFDFDIDDVLGITDFYYNVKILSWYLLLLARKLLLKLNYSVSYYETKFFYNLSGMS